MLVTSVDEVSEPDEGLKQEPDVYSGGSIGFGISVGLPRKRLGDSNGINMRNEDLDVFGRTLR